MNPRLALGECGVYGVGVALGIFHAHNHPAVLVAGEVDLQKLGAAHPRNISLIAALNVSAGDDHSRQSSARHAPTEGAPPTFAKGLSSDDFF